MTAQGWNRLKELFAEAQALDPAERPGFLDRTCGDDRELRAELESLLAAEQSAESFLETPAADVLLGDVQAPAPSPLGRRFGAYRVLSEIGRGGMGVVYRAVRDDDAFHKEVALKLLHTDLESEFFEERFRRERRILASLEHPNIAGLLDAGADETGRLYCVMELVEGSPIDVHCRERGLGIAARIELVRTACGAVALAHSRLVVHCDLKPANHLVTADGTLKLLDFGIAKLLAPDPTDPSPMAPATGWWMTPEYASPEQVRGEPVTTATDVYALGVMLYELLTGRRPYDLGSRSAEEMLRAICEQEVTRPSQAVMRPLPADPSERTAMASPAGPPDGNLRRLRRSLEGDLDTIVLRAMAKDPGRRYTSVGQLSEDLRRHLSGLPIRARPDRLAYRAGKFLGRHRAASAATLLAFVSLCGGLVATLQQARVARTERAVAERRFDEVRRLAGTFVFEIEKQVAELPGSTPVRKRIVEVGLEYLERLEREAGDDAALKTELAGAFERIAAVQGGVGVANLGDAEGAIASQRRAVALREAILLADPAALDARLSLASSHGTLGDLLGASGDREGQGREYDAALELRRAAATAAPDDPRVRRAVASSLWDSAQLRADEGDYDGALGGFEESLAIYRSLGEAPTATDADRRNLALGCKKVGAVRSVAGDPEGALEMLSAALVIDQERLAANPGRTETMLDVSFDHGDLGYVLLELGQPRQAAAHYGQAVDLRRTVSEVDPEDVRARDMLRSGRLRLAGALAAVIGDGEGPCAELQPVVDEALALWSDAEAGGALDADAAAERRRLQAAAARCAPGSPPP
jgi:non-specific serine/threonine protein kinase/serine/threonine-protein kinase